MTSFFGELGRKLAERWVSLLVLPGLLLAATIAVAVALGHSAALDWNRLTFRADRWVRDLGELPGASQVLLLGVLLLGCTGAGLVVRALAGVTQRLWLGAWPSWAAAVSRPLVARRVVRWEAARTAAARTTVTDEIARATARRNEIALARPTRPTWIGDRIAGVDTRVFHQYGVDLQSWWPRLWLVVDDSTRSELRAARSAFDTAAVQASWAAGYVITALFWWPAGAIAVGVWLTGWSKGRAAARTYAELIESTVDVNAALLAHRLDLLPEHTRLTRQVGQGITAEFRKGT